MTKQSEHEKLINSVRSFPELWNTSLKAYKNAVNKKKIWDKIAKQLNYKDGMFKFKKII